MNNFIKYKSNIPYSFLKVLGFAGVLLFTIACGNYNSSHFIPNRLNNVPSERLSPLEEDDQDDQSEDDQNDQSEDERDNQSEDEWDSQSEDQPERYLNTYDTSNSENESEDEPERYF